MSDLSIGEIRQVQRAISTAAWKLDLWKFAEVLGSNADHDWTKEKFKEFSELSRAINKFATAIRICRGVHRIKNLTRGVRARWAIDPTTSNQLASTSQPHRAGVITD